MKPILTISATNGQGDSPFPTVLYANAAGGEVFSAPEVTAQADLMTVSGNQLYHTSVLLMLQEKPNGLKHHKKQVSFFY